METTARSDKTDGAVRSTFPQRKAFVLQFSTDAGPQTGLFTGRVEHVSSGDAATFESTEDLWRFVRSVMMRPSAAERLALPPSRGKAA